jgi:hypothetical protein
VALGPVLIDRITALGDFRALGVQGSNGVVEGELHGRLGSTFKETAQPPESRRTLAPVEIYTLVLVL